MKQRDRHGILFFGIILLFVGSILFTGSVKGQGPDTDVTPLSIVSTYQLQKETESTPNTPNTLQTTPANDTSTPTLNNEITLPTPETGIIFDKECDPTNLSLGEEIQCTITVTNNSSEDFHYKLIDITSPQLTVLDENVIGGKLHGHNIITQRGFLEGGAIPSFSIEKADTPITYRSLRELGIPPLTDVQDESMTNVSTLDPFIFGGEEYITLGIASNGYIIPGLGSDEDIAYNPQIFPDPTIPNNVIAPFWTDLNPEAGGNIYAARLIWDNASGGLDTWAVIEWENIPAFDSEKPALNCLDTCTDLYTFQAWIKLNTGEQDVTFIYERVDGTGAASGTNIGAENIDATIGANYESIPAAGDELAVVTTPGSEGQSHIISYTAEADESGFWYGCALMKVFQTRDMEFDCTYGTISE